MDAAARKPKSAKLLSLLRKAKRNRWPIRQGPGQYADEMALLNGCEFDHARADHVCDFFEEYGVLTEGPWAGNAFTLLDWQREWLRRAFGWVRHHPEFGYWVRRFERIYLEVPKKNGKTPLAATLGNYLLFGDSLGRQINIFLAATTKTQANRCLKHAIRAYKHREDLDEVAVTKKLEGFDSVEYGDNLWQVVAADAASADGINGHVIADEVHRWVGHEFYNSLRWALASQPEGIFLGITTAGNDPESVCKQCHDKTVEVNSGRQLDERWFGTIYAMDAEDDPHKEETWFKANPSLGTDPESPLKLSSFRADYEAAKRDPTQWPTFLQLRLNQWRNAIAGWLDIGKWDLGESGREDQLRRLKESHDEAQLKIKKLQRAEWKAPDRLDCYEQFSIDAAPGGANWKDLTCSMALDAATVRDTASSVFTFEHPHEDGALLQLPFYWMPESRAVELQNLVPFQHWADAGFIRLTPGDVLDFNQMADDLVELIELFDLYEFYFDPNFQAEWLTEHIASETGVQRIAFGQTISNFSPAMKTAERLIFSKKLRHNGHPIFTWQLGNVQAKTDSNQAKRPIKQKHGDWRTIDGPVCSIMSLSKWVTEVDDHADDDDFDEV